MTAVDHRREYTVNEAAEFVGITAKRLREWIARGELPARRAGRIRLIAREDLQLFRRRHRRNRYVLAAKAR